MNLFTHLSSSNNRKCVVHKVLQMRSLFPVILIIVVSMPLLVNVAAPYPCLLNGWGSLGTVL